MDVVVSVVGTSFLRGSMAKYRLEGGGTICASTPAIPILVSLVRDMAIREDGGDSPIENFPGLVLIVPHSLLATGIDHIGLAWDELNTDKMWGERQFNGFIVEKLSQLVDYIKGIIRGENGEIARVDPEADTSNEELEKALSLTIKLIRRATSGEEPRRFAVVLVQSIGSFPVPYRRESTEESITYGSLTLRGSALDPFTRVYLALKDMWIRGGRGELTIHFDVSSGMNIVTVSALLGARAFSIVHGATLKVYNTDPYIPEIAAHCLGPAVEVKERSFHSVGAPPLGITEIDELMSTMRLVEEISSIPKGGAWDLSLDEARSLMEDIGQELGSFMEGQGEGSTDGWMKLIEALLGHVRRLSCGLRNTAVTYIHRELSNLIDPVRKVYGRKGLYITLREKLRQRMYLDCRDDGLRVFSGPPEKLKEGGIALTYAWGTGPTFILLDAIASLATDIYSDIDLLEESTDFPIRGEFHPKILEGRGVTPDFLLSLADFYLRKGLNLNLVFMLGELELQDEYIEEILSLMKPNSEMPKNLRNNFRSKFTEYVRKRICHISKEDEWKEWLNINEQIYQASGRNKLVLEGLKLFKTYYLIKAVICALENIRGNKDKRDKLKEEYIRELNNALREIEERKSDLDIESKCIEFVKEVLRNEILGNLMGDGWNINHFHTLIEKYLDELSHLTECLMKSIAENVGGLGDILSLIAQDANHNRLEKFLDSTALSFGSKVSNRKVVSLVRNFLAHLGLTHFTVTDIIPTNGSVEVLYDSQLLEKLDESSGLGALGSMCDISSRRSLR